MAEFATRGTAGTALGLSIGALGAQALTGGFGNLFGGLMGGGCNNWNRQGAVPVCSDDMLVNRYELALQQENAALKTQVEMHKAEIYTDNKLEALNDRYEKRFNCIENQIAQQTVHNATSDGLIACMAQQINALQALTKTVIPTASICPEPMARYNSWTAPTTTTPTTT